MKKHLPMSMCIYSVYIWNQDIACVMWACVSGILTQYIEMITWSQKDNSKKVRLASRFENSAVV